MLLESVISDECENKRPMREQLALKLACSATGKTVLRDRHMAYPLSVSPIFRLDADSCAQISSTQTGKAQEKGDYRAYLYRMNTSPGLLAGDRIHTRLQLEAGSALYLADQAATKVHAMPVGEANKPGQAQVNYDIEVGDRATLEFLPEPVILFSEANLRQTTEIALSPTAGLSWGEIILPGRIARGESYQFRECWSTLKLKSLEGENWLVETTRLLGKINRFSPNRCIESELYVPGAVIGLLVLCLPKTLCTREVLADLSERIDALSAEPLQIASSTLPGNRGVFVRAVAQTTQTMQRSFKLAAGYVRQIRNQAPLPYSV